VYGHRSFEWLTTLLYYSMVIVVKKKRMNPQNKDPPLTLPTHAPYLVVSSTNSNAHAPNVNNTREAFPTPHAFSSGAVLRPLEILHFRAMANSKLVVSSSQPLRCFRHHCVVLFILRHPVFFALIVPSTQLLASSHLFSVIRLLMPDSGLDSGIRLLP